MIGKLRPRAVNNALEITVSSRDLNRYYLVGIQDWVIVTINCRILGSSSYLTIVLEYCFDITLYGIVKINPCQPSEIFLDICHFLKNRSEGKKTVFSS